MYQALYRKYRSKTFDDLLGQDQVVIPLKNQVSQGRTSHAYLFSGTRGTGKTSAAKILARAVNCLNPQDGNPCNECENCKLILEDRMMDVVEMDAASNNGVDDIRDLKDRVVYPPGLGKYKVYIIDEVHMLSKGAFNALLKVLEEPPKHLIFILATTEMDKIPQTIQSRCQKYLFRRLSRETMAQGMETILEKEGVQADKEALDLIARHGQGSMRDALSLLEQCLYLGPKLTYEGVVQSLGLMEEDQVQDLLISLVQGEDLSFIEKLHSYYGQGKDLDRLIRDLSYALRGGVLAHMAKNPGRLVDDKLVDLLRPLQGSLDPASWLAGLKGLEESLQDLRFSKDPLLSTEIALLDLKLTLQGQGLKRVKTPDPGNLDLAIDQGRRPGKVEKIPENKVKDKEPIKEEPGPQSKTEEKKKSLDPGKEDPKPQEEAEEFPPQEKDAIIEDKTDLDQADIEEIQDYCKDHGGLAIAAILKDAKFVLEPGRLRLLFQPGYDFHVKNLSKEENKALVQEAVKALIGQDVSLDVALEKDTKEAQIQEVVDFFGQDLIERQ